MCQSLTLTGCAGLSAAGAGWGAVGAAGAQADNPTAIVNTTAIMKSMELL